MSAREAKLRRAPRSRRRTVRIVDTHSSSRTATVSFLILAAVALLAFGGWRYWQTEEPAPALQRPLTEVRLPWQCGRGHSFEAAGRVEPRSCPVCGRQSYIVNQWECKEHGRFDVAVRLRLDADGMVVPDSYRIGMGKWVPAGEEIGCPRCGKPLRHRARDPYESKIRRKERRRGGAPSRGG